MPRIRFLLEDFEVEEIPLYPPCGEGEHTFVLIEKRGIDTEAVVRDLERALRLRRLEIGYAGRKDRGAVTRQWMSLPRTDPAAARMLAGQSWRVLEAAPHRHKLRTGDLVGNRFRVVVREVVGASADRIDERLADLVRRGLPNRFGRQRFGRDGDNAELGAAILRGERGGGRRSRMDRRQVRFLVSALQSELFNRVLERRTAPPWELVDGDLAVVHRSGGLFVVDDAVAESPRAAEFEISPTGPIFGAKMRQPRGAARELEAAVWSERQLPDWDDLALPRGLRVDGTRRPLRVPVTGASLQRLAGEETIELRFELPAGSYATVLIEELFPETTIVEGGAGAGAAAVDANEDGREHARSEA
jgi:tRNA pseudouridine13 synthase